MKTKNQSVQSKFQMAATTMKDSLIERDEEIDVVLTALLCKEHVVLVGPPGTAKSMLLDSLLRWMGPGTNKFNHLINKFSTPEDIFGPIDVLAMRDEKSTPVFPKVRYKKQTWLSWMRSSRPAQPF